jgi:hypothetical protein
MEIQIENGKNNKQYAGDQKGCFDGKGSPSQISCGFTAFGYFFHIVFLG